METILYDTVAQEAISKVFPNGYFVDGVKPSLPSPIVELDVVRDPFPSVDLGSNIVTQEITVTTTEYIFGWEVTPIVFPPPPPPADPFPLSWNISVATSDWTGTGPYTAVKTLTGILTTDIPITDINMASVVFGDVPDVLGEYAAVYRIEVTDDDELTIFATSEPTEPFDFRVIVIR